MNYKESKRIYEEAVEKVREKKLRDAFELYVISLLNRLNSEKREEEEFVLFYRYNLAKYLARKRNYLISLSEGDAVTDLIEKSYSDFIEEINSSLIRVSEVGRRNLLAELNIEFPVEESKEDKEEKLTASN